MGKVVSITKASPLVSSGLQILGAVVLISLCSQVSAPMPFTEVPLTLQSLSVLFLGAVLGSKKSVAAVLSYLSSALFLPVLHGGGCGLIHFGGPTAGYLFGFVLAAWIAGKGKLAMEKGRSLSTLFWLILASLSILVCGSLWISVLCSKMGGLSYGFKIGFYPFVPVEVIKVSLLFSGLRSSLKFLSIRTFFLR